MTAPNAGFVSVRPPRRRRGDFRQRFSLGCAGARLATPAPRPPVRAARSALRQAHRLAKVLERVDLVRDRHGGDEMLLEARLDRRLDFFDSAHHVFDLAPRGGVEQRDARARPRRVAGGGDFGEIAIGDEAERHRIGRIDMAAERAGQRDALGRGGAEALDQQLGAGIERRLGELNGANIGLIDHQARLAVMQQIAEGAADRLDALILFGEGAVDHAVFGNDPGEIHLGDDFDNARAADAGNAGRSRRFGEAFFVRPELATDHLETRLQSRAINAYPLDRARGGALAAGNLRAFEGGPGRRGAGEQAAAIAEDDLGVRADIDQQREIVAKIRAFGQDHAGRIGADMAGNARKAIDKGAWRDAQAQFRSARLLWAVDGQGERRAAKLGRIEAESEVMHDRIADQRDLYDVLALGRGLVDDIADQRVECAAHALGQFLVAARIHHHVRNPAHQVFAEPDLRIHRPGRGEHVAARKIAEMGGDGGRADVERDAERAVAEAGIDGDDVAAVAQGDGRLPLAGAQSLLQAAQDGKIGDRLAKRPLALQSRLQPAQIARRIMHIGLAHLDIVEAHDRIDLDRLRFGALAHDLALNLRIRRHVDDEIAADFRLAAEAAAVLERSALLDIALLDAVPGRDVIGRRDDAVLGEMARRDLDLAAAANAAAAADRIEIDAEAAGRFEHARAFRQALALARRREDNEMIAQHLLPGAAAPFAAAAAFASGGLALRRRLAILSDPGGAIRVVAHHHISAEDRLPILLMKRVHDRRGHPGADHHRQERGAEAAPVGQAEGEIGGAAGRVDLQLLAQPSQKIGELRAGVVDRADRHDQRIDDHVLTLDAEILRALDDFLGDGVAYVWILGNAGLVVRNGDHRGVVFLDQRQDALEPLLFAGDRIDERAPLIDGEPGFERLDDRGIDRQRHGHGLLHQLDAIGENFRFVGERHAGIDVEHLRAGFNLRDRVGDDAAVIAGRHFRGEQFAPRGIDALADHNEAAVEADDDFAFVGA